MLQKRMILSDFFASVADDTEVVPPKSRKSLHRPQYISMPAPRIVAVAKKIGRCGCATAYGFKAINYLSLADRQEVYALDDFLAFIAEAEVDKLLSDWAKWLALVGQVVERAG